MFDPDHSYTLLPQANDPIEADVDRLDGIDIVTRFCAWFTVGIAVTLLIRLLPSLQPFYWILVIAGMTSLVISLYFTRNVRLLAIAALLIAITVAGHWDGLSHQVQPTTQPIQQVSEP